MPTSPSRLTMFGDDDAVCVDGVCHVPSVSSTAVTEATREEPEAAPAAKAIATEVAH